MARLIRLAVNDFVNGVCTIVNDTQTLYLNELDQDDVNILRETLKMFDSEQGKILLDYTNNTMLLSHPLLSVQDHQEKKPRLSMNSQSI